MKNTQKMFYSRVKSVSQNQNLSTRLSQLLIQDLKKIFWAENKLLEELPFIWQYTTTVELKTVLINQMAVCSEHLDKLDKIFNTLDKITASAKCEIMTGFIEETRKIVNETHSGSVRDAAIIALMQKIKHYQISTYGTLRAFADLMHLHLTEELLAELLQDEKDADLSLTGIAISVINKAAHENDYTRSISTENKFMSITYR